MAYKLTVPFECKDEARALGAKWDSSASAWFWVAGDFPRELVKFTGNPKHINPSYVMAYVNAYIAKQKEMGFDDLGSRPREAIKAQIEASGVMMYV